MTGIESYLDMQKSRLNWKGLDDANVVEPVLPKDLPNFVVAFSAQRIRHFYFQYVPVATNNSSDKRTSEEEQIVTA